jgi:hypothetical protein
MGDSQALRRRVLFADETCFLHSLLPLLADHLTAILHKGTQTCKNDFLHALVALLNHRRRAVFSFFTILNGFPFNIPKNCILLRHNAFYRK